MSRRSQFSHTTVFWRNAPQLTELGVVLAPRWLAAQPRWRVLVCGGSIGCEALSLGMTLDDPRTEILSVEIEESVTQAARRLEFATEYFEPLFGVEGGLPPALRERWFEPVVPGAAGRQELAGAEVDTWRPIGPLARLCRFETADLTAGLDGRTFEILCCQNVLTHHEPAAAERILDAVLALAAPQAIAVVSGLDLALKQRCAAAGFLPWTGRLQEIHEAFVTHRRHYREDRGRYYFELEDLAAERPDAALRYATLFYRGSEPIQKPKA